MFIPGGAGGVGHLAIQLAKWKGAQVITTTSTRNVAFVRELGADLVIDYTRASVADVVLDMMGEDVLRQAFGGMVERDQGARRDGSAKDERLDSSRNATRLPICSPTTSRTTRPKS